MATILMDPETLDAVTALLRGLGATEIFVFGSIVKEGLRPDSDIDMAVRGLPPAAYFTAISKASALLGRPLDLVDVDDVTPKVEYLIRSGELLRVA
jgi:predicted nucleotidyltransferase